MMRLQEQIKKDLTSAIKAKDETTKEALRVVLGEFARSEKKDLSDDKAIRVLKKLVKLESENLHRTGAAGPSPYIQVIERYLPKMTSAPEIKAWIQANVDFSQYQNKMQAMGIIMKHFGTTADGSLVRQILQEM